MARPSARSVGVRSRAVWTLVIGLGLAGCGAAQPGSKSPALGVVIGSIRAGGGPAPLSGVAPEVAGVVTVFTEAGREVAQGDTRPGTGARFVLAPGRYQLNAGPQLHSKEGCPPTKVVVRGGQTMRVAIVIGCRIP